MGPVHAPLRSVRVRRPMAWETAGAWEPPSFEKNKKARYFFDGSVSHGNVGLSGLFALMVNIKTIIITACFCCMAAALLPA